MISKYEICVQVKLNKNWLYLCLRNWFFSESWFQKRVKEKSSDCWSDIESESKQTLTKTFHLPLYLNLHVFLYNWPLFWPFSPNKSWTKITTTIIFSTSICTSDPCSDPWVQTNKGGEKSSGRPRTHISTSDVGFMTPDNEKIPQIGFKTKL